MGVLVKNRLSSGQEEISEFEKYGFHEPASNKKLDGFTALAAILLDAPMAAISIVDADKIWYVSKYGIEKEYISKVEGICSFNDSSNLFFVEDTLKSECLKTHPMVAGETQVRFYAQVPLVNEEGRRLGSLCVMDHRPKPFTNEHRRLLELVADLLMQALEEEYRHRNELEVRNQMILTTVHDLKNPLAVIPLLGQMIKDNKEDPEMVLKLAVKIQEASLRLSRSIEEFLSKAGEREAAVQSAPLRLVNMKQLVKEVVRDNKPMAARKKQLIHFRAEDECQVLGDRKKLKEMFDNLLSNAIKYSFTSKNIWIELASQNEMALLKVRDEGVGLSTGDLNKLYRPFTTLSSRPTGGEHSSGLGLSIVKRVVEEHKGRIRAISAGHAMGTTFTVELPLANV